jgi:hypothetical protein
MILILPLAYEDITLYNIMHSMVGSGRNASQCELFEIHGELLRTPHIKGTVETSIPSSLGKDDRSLQPRVSASGPSSNHYCPL